MSKPRPFINSFWGIAIMLALAIAILGINNYRGHRAGFNLTFASISVIPTDKKQADTFRLVTTAEDFTKLCQPTEPVNINWDKQRAFVYLAPAQSTSGYRISPTSIHRDSATININYQLTAPDTNQSVTTTTSYIGTAILVDRAKLISSSELLVNLMADNNVVHSLKLSPNQL